MPRDLFGEEYEPRVTQDNLGDLRAGSVDELRERWRTLQQRADLDPEDEEKAKRAARAKAAYLGLRDFHKGRSLEEQSARAAALEDDERRFLDPATRDAFDE